MGDDGERALLTALGNDKLSQEKQFHKRDQPKIKP